MEKEQLDRVWEELGYNLGKAGVGCRFLKVDELGEVGVASDVEAVKKYIVNFILKLKQIGVVDGYDVTEALKKGLSLTQVLFNITSVLVLEPKRVVGADGKEGLKLERSLITLNKNELTSYGLSLSEAQEKKYMKQVKINEEVSDIVVLPRVTLTSLGEKPRVSVGTKQKTLVSGMELVPSRMFIGYVKALRELLTQTRLLKVQYKKSNGQLRTQYISSDMEVLEDLYKGNIDIVAKYMDLVGYIDNIVALRGLWDVPDLLLGKQGKTLTRKVSLVGLESITKVTQEEYIKLKELIDYDLSKVVGVSTLYLGRFNEEQLLKFKRDWKLDESLRLDQVIDEIGNLEIRYTTNFKEKLLKYMLDNKLLFVGVEEMLKNGVVEKADVAIDDLDLLYHVGY